MAAKLERCFRILTLVPWLQNIGTSTFGEVSKRFDYKPKELLRDLMTLTMVGIPPYLPGDLTLIEFDPSDDVYTAFENEKSPKSHWEISMPQKELFLFPPKLNASETLILLTAYSFIQTLNLELDPVTQQTLEKIKKSLAGNSTAEAKVSFSIEADQSNVQYLNEIQEAIKQQHQIQIHYHSLRDSETDYYTIEPYQVYFSNNAWYLDAHSQKNNERRVFRVLRIKDLKLTQDKFTQEVPELDKNQTMSAYVPDEKDPKVVLELDPQGRWALDLVQASGVREIGGKTEVTLHIGTQGFLERLLLQVGKNGRIVSGNFDKDLASKVAKSLLKKYD